MATINLPANGQILTDIPDYIASDDQLLRDLLSPTMPDLASATFERKTVGDLLTVTVSKRAGTKGGEAKHTPGPWKMKRSTDGQYYLITAGGDWERLACEIDSYDCDSEMAEANANLITTSPDLLAACEAALTAMERATSEGATIFDQIAFGDMLPLRVVIQKAKGVQ